jgi:DNA anti-recombination protein RmuC
MAEMEFGGVKFKGGKMMVLFTALSTLSGALWAGFEFYKDYMDMKEIVQNIDVQAIENSNNNVLLKMDEQMIRIEEAIEYTRDIKSGLRDDIMGIEKQVDRMEDQMREQEQEVRDIVASAEERFENKRDSLQNDYDSKANDLRDRNDSRMTDLENQVERDLKELDERLSDRLQKALDNPLAN